MVAVAVVAHAVVDGMPWAAAFTLGAIVSPTDPIAASTIAKRLGVNRRVVSIVEGESLINDGTALVAYKFAVAAVITGAFSLAEASLEFVWNVVGGIAIGLIVAYGIRQVRKRINHPPTEIAIALLSGYLGFLPGECARRVGRPGRCGGRHLHGLVHAGADRRGDPPSGRGRVGDRLLRP